MHRGARFALGLIALAVVVSAALVSPAHAAKGQWSIGGNFGTGIYSNSALNDSVAAALPGFKKIKSGWEYGGSIRYGVSPKVSLDYEVNTLNGKSTTPNPSGDIHGKTTGIAAPLSLYYQLGTSGKSEFDFFFGAGPLLGTKWHLDQAGTVVESKKKTALYAHAGFEGDYKLSKSFAITARALGRIAKAKDLTEHLPSDDPSVKFDVDLSGAAFSLGLRAFFGKY